MQIKMPVGKFNNWIKLIALNKIIFRLFKYCLPRPFFYETSPSIWMKDKTNIAGYVNSSDGDHTCHVAIVQYGISWALATGVL